LPEKRLRAAGILLWCLEAKKDAAAQGKNFVNLSSKFTIQKSTSVTAVKAEPWPLSQLAKTFGTLEGNYVVARPFLERGVAPDPSLVTRQRRSGASRVAYFLLSIAKRARRVRQYRVARAC
jgi:hypothetical protein